MGSLDSHFLVEIDKVDGRSRVKHKGENWRDMKFSYVFMKSLGHLLKWWFAGRGRYNGRKGPHHLAKCAWYFDKIMWMERHKNGNDDRPTNIKGQMALTVVVNKVKTVLADMRKK